MRIPKARRTDPSPVQDLMKVIREMPAILAMLDRNGDFLFLNRDDARRFKGDAVGKNVFDFVHPESQNALRNALEQVFTKGEACHFETAVVRQGGAILWYRSRVSPLRGSAGVVAAVFVSEDITETKKAQTEAAGSALDWTLTFDSMGDGVTVIGSDYTVLNVNEALCKLLGAPKERLIGKKCYELFHNASEPDEDCLFRRMKASGGQESKELYNDRLKRTLHVAATPIFSKGGSIDRVIHVVRDVTEVRRTERLRQEQEVTFRTLVGNVPAIVYRVHLKDGNRMEFFNDYHEEMTGHNEGLEHGKVCDIDPLIVPEDRPRVIETVDKAVAGMTPFTVEYRINHADGSIRWFQERGMPIAGQDGKPAFIDGVIFDTTVAKRAEDGLRKSLDEQDALMRELHHRVKNNLQIISSLLNLQSRQVKDPKAQEAFRESQDRIRSMALIHERLYRSKSRAEVEFSEYIRHLVKDLFSSYNIRPDRISLRLELEDMRLPIDTAVPCGLLVNELVLNSLKHAFPGDRKGTVTIKVGAGKVGKRFIEVGDDGVGLPAGFDFRKTDTLGMQMVCILTEQLEGDIRLERSGGTAFRIEFRERD